MDLYSQEIQKKKKDPQNRPQTIKKMAIGTYISIITLNVNELNAPTKSHRLTEWIKKQDPYICCLQETHFRPQNIYRLKVRGWKNIYGPCFYIHSASLCLLAGAFNPFTFTVIIDICMFLLPLS